MPELERDDNVFVLRLDESENRFHPDWLAAVDAALDEVERAEGPRALVTAGTGKFWSNGLDLDWLGANLEQIWDYLTKVHALFARTLASSVVTVAAMNGHAFAGGAMWALAHDLRVMRADRGFFCLPEVDLGLNFQPGMAALVQAKLAPNVAHEAMSLGSRYGGKQALAAGIVDEIVAEDEVLDTAVKRAGELAAKSTPARGVIKETIHAATLAALRAEPTRDQVLQGGVAEMTSS